MFEHQWILGHPKPISSAVVVKPPLSKTLSCISQLLPKTGTASGHASAKKEVIHFHVWFQSRNYESLFRPAKSLQKPGLQPPQCARWSAGTVHCDCHRRNFHRPKSPPFL